VGCALLPKKVGCSQHHAVCTPQADDTGCVRRGARLPAAGGPADVAEAACGGVPMYRSQHSHACGGVGCAAYSGANHRSCVVPTNSHRTIHTHTATHTHTQYATPQHTPRRSRAISRRACWRPPQRTASPCARSTTRRPWSRRAPLMSSSTSCGQTQVGAARVCWWRGCGAACVALRSLACRLPTHTRPLHAPSTHAPRTPAPPPCVQCGRRSCGPMWRATRAWWSWTA
jgi:hypothetical protein